MKRIIIVIIILCRLYVSVLQTVNMITGNDKGSSKAIRTGPTAVVVLKFTEC